MRGQRLVAKRESGRKDRCVDLFTGRTTDVPDLFAGELVEDGNGLSGVDPFAL